MTDQNPNEQWQAMFQPASMMMGTWQKNAHAFWKTQVEILDGMQAFAEGWFQRRHLGTQAADEACERLCAAKTPVEWFHEYQSWCSGACQRLMADGLSFQDGMKKAVEGVSPSVVPSFGAEQHEVKPAASKVRVRAEA